MSTVSLTSPTIGSVGWGASVNDNFSQLQSALNAGPISCLTSAEKNIFVSRYDSSNEQSGLYTDSPGGQAYWGTNIDHSSTDDVYSRGTIPAARWGNPQGNGSNGFYIYVAPAGTAGTTITWTIALLIVNAGDLLTVLTTAASSPSTGSLVNGGGIGVAGNVYNGTDFWLLGDFYFANANAATSTAVNKIIHYPRYNNAGQRFGVAEIDLARSSSSDSTYDGYIAFLTCTGGTLAEAARFEKTQNLLIGTTTDDGNNRLQIARTVTLGSATSDGYAASVASAPTYDQAHTVTRHNYVQVKNPSLTSSAAMTDACVLRFDAAAGTHKAVDGNTTKATPTAVDAWMKVNINGTIHYVPFFLSKTA
jgi:hypothetical protein